MDDTKFLTPAQLVARWGHAVKVGTLANQRSNGTGPGFTKVRGRVLYPLAEVLAYEARGARASKDNAGKAKGAVA